MPFKMKYEIKQDLLPLVSKGRRQGSKLGKVIFLVAHDVGNDGLDAKTGKKNGTTAKANINYYKNTPTEQASAHVFIDDIEILVCVPLTEKLGTFYTTLPQTINYLVLMPMMQLLELSFVIILKIKHEHKKHTKNTFGIWRIFAIFTD